MRGQRSPEVAPKAQRVATLVRLLRDFAAGGAPPGGAGEAMVALGATALYPSWWGHAAGQQRFARDLREARRRMTDAQDR